MANVIEQIVQPSSFGTQTIEVTVRSNERGAQGPKGDRGESATITAGNAYSIAYGQQPKVMNSGTPGEAVLDFYLPEGKPGAIHYTAGPGINITEDNRIEATGEAATYWGDLVGNMSDQTDLTTALNGKQNKLTAGTNITISGNTISAQSYTAGSGLNLNGSEFSVDTDTIQTKLTAGSNIQIESGTISATDTTYNNFVGATADTNGSAGLVPAPVASSQFNVLKGDGGWSKIGAPNITDGAITAIKLDKASVVDLFYPVGTYYETSDTSFDPNEAWGGTWQLDSQGRVTVSQDSGTFTTVGATGGEETHTLNVQEIPDHYHAIGGGGTFGNAGGAEWYLYNGGTEARWSSHTGGGQSHNNLQPYIVVKRWHRTA